MQEKLESIYVLIEKMIEKRPAINKIVFQSEWETAHRNRAFSILFKGEWFSRIRCGGDTRGLPKTMFD